MDISIIIPIFNEQKNLPILHKELCSVFKSLGREYELIYIDDGSTDNSIDVLKNLRLEKNRVRIIGFNKNYGKTSAIDAGLHAATGNFVLTIDADLQNDVTVFVEILKELEKYDAVVCYRCNRIEADGFIKFASSKIANYIRNKVLKENFKDAGCFFGGYRKKCLEGLILYRGFQVFIRSLLDRYKIKEIPIKSYRRRYGKSKYNIRNRLFSSLWALFIVKYLKTKAMKYKIIYSIRR